MHNDCRKIKVTLVSLNIRRNYSIALGYLKLYALKDPELKKRSIFNEIQERVTRSSKYLAIKILLTRPDILGFSCNVWNVQRTLKVARFIKKLSPKTVIVFGGQEVTNSSIDYLESNSQIDIIVDGEGEETFKQILKSYMLDNLDTLDQINGISYRKCGIVKVAPPTEQIKNLDSIPSPYLADEIKVTPKSHLGMMIETSRGCRFKCSFCFEGNKYKSVRYFSIDTVEKEVAHMVQKGVSSFHILDPILGNSDNERLNRINGIIEKYIVSLKNYSLSVEIYAEHVNEDLIGLLKHFTIFDIGLQSITPAALRNIRRGHVRHLFLKGVNLLKRLNQQTNIYLLLGLPGENFFLFLQGVRFTILLDISRLFINHLLILNGTQLRNESRKHKLCFSKSPPYITLSNTTFSENEIFLARVFGDTIVREHDAKIRQLSPMWKEDRNG